MDDFAKYELSGGDPEQINELRRLQRKQMVADMLMKQSMQSPQGQMIGNVYVPPSPMQGIAQLANAYFGNRANQSVEQGRQQLGEKSRAQTAEAMQRYQQGMTGTPEQTTPGMEPSDGMGPPSPPTVQPAQPATREQKIAAIRDAILGNNPRLNKMGQFDFQAMNAEQARKEAAQSKMDQLKAQAEAKSEADRLRAQDKLDQIEAARIARGDRPSAQPYFSPFDSSSGAMVFDHRTGKMVPAVVNGATVKKAVSDPTLQGELAGAKAGGKEFGVSQAKAQIALPEVIDTAERTIKLIDEILVHPGLQSTVGVTLAPGARFIEGSKEADFMARLKQIQGGAFLQAFETLKGGGQITEIEGEKATVAINRMNKAQSETEFVAAANDFKNAIKKGVEKARIKAGANVAPKGLPSMSDIDAEIARRQGRQ